MQQVLTLSAWPRSQGLAPLSIGRGRLAAAALGGLWGFGHSTGQLVLGLVFASVAGIMIYICFDELLPAAQRTGAKHHLMMFGVTAGMLVMSISLVLLT